MSYKFEIQKDGLQNLNEPTKNSVAYSVNFHFINWLILNLLQGNVSELYKTRQKIDRRLFA